MMQRPFNRSTQLLCSYNRFQNDKKVVASFASFPRYFFSSSSAEGGSNSNTNSILPLLHALKSGQLSVNDAHQKLVEKYGPEHSDDISEEVSLDSFANLDHKRATRTGFPEAVFAAGKTPQQVATILDDMAKNVNSIIKEEKLQEDDVSNFSQKAILATRVDQKLFEEVSKIPLKHGTIMYHKMAKIISMRASELEIEVNDSQDHTEKAGNIVVACAGTTDLPVAEEAAITLEAAGCNVERIYDVGVAGLHRIINALPRLRCPEVDCVIVCAGMDGALPSVVAGLVSVPVVAVPTSVGYGASFGGVSAMLTMLNSCAPGVGVVNIDNGFGGAALAFKCIKKEK